MVKMIPYFVTYIIFTIIALSNNRKLLSNKILWSVSCIYLVFFIGFRQEVGGDWWTYLSSFENVNNLSIEFILLHSDIGYHAINLLISNLDLSIHFVNLICAIIFMYGLAKFAKCENNQWLIILIALPYTINIVAMGYTRQAVALGLILLSIVALREKKLLKFVIIIIIAATFHKTTIIIMGLGIFISGKGKVLKNYSNKFNRDRFISSLFITTN
ncbi:MAG: EpsG family protein [Aliarcobacter sp.]|nr:EpsG family protein [Aliarcobacter sp.]